MAKLPGINHSFAIKAFEKAGYTMAGIIKDAGLTIENFKKLL